MTGVLSTEPDIDPAWIDKYHRFLERDQRRARSTNNFGVMRCGVPEDEFTSWQQKTKEGKNKEKREMRASPSRVMPWE